MKLVLPIIFLFLVVSANGQTLPSPTTDPTGLAKVLKEDGWSIPGIGESQVISGNTLPKGTQSGGAVHYAVLKPQSELIVSIPTYGLRDAAKTLFIGQRRGEVNLIFKCEVNQRVFAYIVQLVEVFYDSQNKRSGYGEIYGARYYDDDGNGIFETYEPGEGYVKDLRVPGWASKAK